MADIVWLLRNDCPCNGDIGCAQELCNQAADEIERLRQVLHNTQQARVLQGKAVIDADDQLCVSRETTLQLLGQVGQLSEEVSRLKDGEARLRAALREAYEVYAGSDGFIPETASEGYQQQIIKQMVNCISTALKEKSDE